MKEYQTNQIRNIALVSHNGAGKTTLIERLLFNIGATTRMGNVQSGSTMMDFEEEEQERQSSVSSAVAPIEWKDTKLNMIDTPGYIDFVGEVNSALSVVEGALILVEAIAGVEVGTELVSQYAADRNLPRILVVNKMDRENVRVQRVMRSLTENLEGNFVPMQIAMGEGASFKGVVDLLSMSAYTGEENTKGEIPADWADEAEEARLALIEAAAEGDDDLMEKFFEEDTLSDEEIVTGLRGAMAQGLVIPIFFSAPEPGIAINPLLDGLAQLFPAPNEAPSRQAVDKSGAEVEIIADDNEPLAAFVFKSREDSFGKMSYVRVFSGALSSDSRVQNGNLAEEVRLGTISVLTGKETQPVGKLHAGDIGMAVKLGDTLTGHTLCNSNAIRIMPAIPQPEPIDSRAIHPVAQSDVAKMSQALSRLVVEDPTLRWHAEQATRETILQGMGTAHLDIAIKKAKSKFGLNLTTTVPKIPYRETITKTASAEYTHKKQTGGAGQYARVFLRVESLGDDETFEFDSEIFGGSISAPFVSAVEKGCRQALEAGPLGNFPVVGVKAIVYDGKEHPVDSKEIAFQIAGREGFRKAAMQADPVLLEPIYEITVAAPSDNMGDIMGDINSRRARVLGVDQSGQKVIIRAEAPLAEVQTYTADLRSMTQGRGVFSMKFLRYGRVPTHLQQQIAEARQKEKEEAG